MKLMFAIEIDGGLHVIAHIIINGVVWHEEQESAGIHFLRFTNEGVKKGLYKLLVFG